jgi:hypothetical protein
MNIQKFAEAASQIDNAIRTNEAVKAVIVEASGIVTGDESGETRKSVQEFLDAPLGDKKEMAMKKAYAAAVALAKDRGLLPDIPEAPSAIAAVVDEGLGRVKVAYNVAVGKITPEEGFDYIVDLSAARAKSYVDYAFDSGLVREAVALGATRLAYAIPYIGPVIGPVVQSYQPLIKSVVARVEKPAKALIKTGINTVANVAKAVGRKVVETAGSVLKTTVSFAAKAWSKVTSIFS